MRSIFQIQKRKIPFKKISSPIIHINQYLKNNTLKKKSFKKFCTKKDSSKSKLMTNFKVAYFTYVWPEPTSSAAGIRNWQIGKIFQKHNCEISWFSHSKQNDFSEKLQKEFNSNIFQFPLNSSLLEETLIKTKPDMVVFDRFLVEEQIGQRVRESVPEAMTILDTQDLHSLRKFREKQILSYENQFSISQNENNQTIDFFKYDPKNLPKAQDQTLWRELASIYRSDLTLVVSNFEKYILNENFNIPREKIFLAPFYYEEGDILKIRELSNKKKFQQRKNFVTIGSFRHPPNRDQIEWLKKSIWPKVRKAIPEASLDIFGSYPTKKFSEMSNPEEKFFVKGFIPNQYETLSRYKVALCPVRFGAGIKGKICSSFLTGTPVVTNQMGSEGMILNQGFDKRNENENNEIFGGKISKNENEFIEHCKLLYENQEEWEKAQERGFLQIESQFSEKVQAPLLWNKILTTFENLKLIRETNYIGEILLRGKNQWQTSFSSFLEAKGKLSQFLSPSKTPVNSFNVSFSSDIVNSEIYKYRDETKTFILKPFNWDQIVEILKKGTIGSFGRTKENVKKYLEVRENVRKNYLTLADPILEREFNCPIEIVEGKKKAIRPNSFKPAYLLTPNRYPYNVEENIDHLLIWSLFPLDKQTVEYILDIELQGKKILYFENFEALKSIPDLSHVHVFVFNED